jgi:hypothetical protein
MHVILILSMPIVILAVRQNVNSDAEERAIAPRAALVLLRCQCAAISCHLAWGGTSYCLSGPMAAEEGLCTTRPTLHLSWGRHPCQKTKIATIQKDVPGYVLER